MAGKTVPRVRAPAKAFATICNPAHAPFCCRVHLQQRKDTDNELSYYGVTCLEPPPGMTLPALLQLVSDEDGDVNLVVLVAQLLRPTLSLKSTTSSGNKLTRLLNAVSAFKRAPGDWLVPLDTSTPLDLSQYPLSFESICAQYKALKKTDTVPTDALATIVGHRLQQSAREEMLKNIAEFVKAPTASARLELLDRANELALFAPDMVVVNAHQREAMQTLRALVTSNGTALALEVFGFMEEINASVVRVLPNANTIAPLSPLMFT